VETWRRSAVDSERPLAIPESVGGFAEEKRRVVQEFEARYVKDALRAATGNIAEAARRARVDRKNFWTLMKRHGIDAAPFKPRP
jgi:DNA-binding NtrC family response regulator